MRRTKTKKIIALAVAAVMATSLFSMMSFGSNANTPTLISQNAVPWAERTNANRFPVAIASSGNDNNMFRVDNLNNGAARSDNRWGPNLITGTTTFNNQHNLGHNTAYSNAFGADARWIAIGDEANRNSLANEQPMGTGMEQHGHMNVWFGIDFGAVRNLNSLSFEMRLNNNRRHIETFVVEVANNPTFTPTRDNSMAWPNTLNRPAANANSPLHGPEMATIDPQSWNLGGWTVVGGTQTVTRSEVGAGGFATYQVVNVNLPANTAGRYIRVRSLTTALPEGRTAAQETLPVNINELQVFGSVPAGVTPPTGQSTAIVVGLGVVALAGTAMVVASKKRRVSEI